MLVSLYKSRTLVYRLPPLPTGYTCFRAVTSLSYYLINLFSFLNKNTLINEFIYINFYSSEWLCISHSRITQFSLFQLYGLVLGLLILLSKIFQGNREDVEQTRNPITRPPQRWALVIVNTSAYLQCIQQGLTSI